MVICDEPIYNKKYAMFAEIISQYHPNYKNLGREQKKLFLDRVQDLSAEHLVEQCFAPRHEELCKEANMQTLYSHIPGGRLCDLSDDSDVKCVMHTSRQKKKGGKQHKTTVHIRASDGGEFKLGALRVVLWNNLLNVLEYYFFPKTAWQQWNGNSSTFTLTSGADGIIKNAIPYKCEDFDELVMMTDSKMEEIARERTHVPTLWDIFGE